MMNGGRCVRAFRPSHFSAADDYDEDAEQAKAMNLQVYAARVEAGLPLFDKRSPATVVEMRSQSDGARS